MNMESSEIFGRLGFTPAWIDAGVVTESILRHFDHECERTRDPNPEHYRWKAFQSYVRHEQDLSPEGVEKLFDLALAEANDKLSAAMVGAVLNHSNCPATCLETARTLPQAHLTELADAIIRRRGEIQPT